MLLLIGAIGLLVTIHHFRLPDVPFFSIITVFNRKQKLTETGSKVYLVFFVVIVLGLLLRLGSGSPGIVPDTRQPAADTTAIPKSSDADVSTVSSSTADERPSAADAEVVAPADPDATGGYRMALDHLFVTYMLANEPQAEGFRDTCNELLTATVSESTVGRSREKQFNALRQCTKLAKSLCSSKSLDPCSDFELQSAKFQNAGK
ncbi:hypothetical protein [Massilia timonae]|uniref:hypothetical protein n=1 Tax=Massilia timonae TaxID=47229 RepID=UPI0028D382CA|nr:hypothetical protein [Massilia timonae]